MRISGVNNLITYNPLIYSDTQVYKTKRLQTLSADVFEKSYDSPSFTALITSPYQFKAITKKHVIRCPYCDCYLLYEGTLDRMLKSGKFNGTVEDFLEAAMPYKKYLKPWRRRFLRTLKKYASKNPEKNLADAIQDMYPKAVKKLIRKQAKVLKKLERASRKLPSKEIKAQFDEFMKIQHNRLYEIPYIEKFRGKVFFYKLNKILKTTNDIKAKRYLLHITKPLEDPIFKDLSNEIPKSVIKKITRGKPLSDKTAKGVISYVLRKVKIIAKKNNRKDIIQLCENSEKMLNSQPVIINFSNKEFVYELRNHQLIGLSQTAVYKKMVEIVKGLPSSNADRSSFIVKQKNSDSNTIGYKLFEPSIATIEHIKPRSLNGKNRLENMALACRADNNKRGNAALPKYLGWRRRRKPQHYFTDLIQVNKKKRYLDPETIEQMAHSFESEGVPRINLRSMRRQKSN